MNWILINTRCTFTKTFLWNYITIAWIEVVLWSSWKGIFPLFFFSLVLSLYESDLHSPSLQRTDVDVGSFGLSFVVSLWSDWDVCRVLFYFSLAWIYSTYLLFGSILLFCTWFNFYFFFGVDFFFFLVLKKVSKNLWTWRNTVAAAETNQCAIFSTSLRMPKNLVLFNFSFFLGSGERGKHLKPSHLLPVCVPTPPPLLPPSPFVVGTHKLTAVFHDVKKKNTR